MVCPVRYRPTTLALRPAEVTITRGADGVLPVVVIVRLVKARTRRYLPQPTGLRRHLWDGAGARPAPGAGPGEEAGV